jgi:hypothetical protein
VTIFELLSFEVTGATLCYLGIVSKLKKYKVLVIFFIGVIIFLILQFDIFVEIKGFIYIQAFFLIKVELVFLFKENN